MVDFYNQNPFLPGQVAGAIAPGGQIPGMPGAAPVPPQVAPPFTPAPPGPAPGAAPIQLQPQQTGFERAMNSPWAAMAFGGLNNLAAGLQNQPMQQDPFAAYQNAVARNAELALRQRAENRTQRTADQKADPFFEYEEARRRGLIPEEMSLAEFERMGLKGLAAPSSQREWEYYSSLSEDDKKAYLEMKRSGSTFGGPAGSTRYRGAGGGVEELTTPEEMIAGEEELTEAEVRAKARAETDAAFVDLMDTGGYDELEQSLQDTENLLAEIEGGGMQATGPLEGMWSQFMGDPDTARLRAQSVLQTLKNLQITNLAPVTEKELQLVQDIYANIDRDPAQNIALLRQAADMLRRKMEIIERKGKYFTQKGTLSGYGTTRFAPKEPAGNTDTAPKPTRRWNPETRSFEDL